MSAGVQNPTPGGSMVIHLNGRGWANARAPRVRPVHLECFQNTGGSEREERRTHVTERAVSEWLTEVGTLPYQMRDGNLRRPTAGSRHVF